MEYADENGKVISEEEWIEKLHRLGGPLLQKGRVEHDMKNAPEMGWRNPGSIYYTLSSRYAVIAIRKYSTPTHFTVRKEE